jgi:hypothetical protein
MEVILYLRPNTPLLYREAGSYVMSKFALVFSGLLDPLRKGKAHHKNQNFVPILDGLNTILSTPKIRLLAMRQELPENRVFR